MADVSFEEELIERVRRLDAEKQRKVLDYVRDLERPKGESGRVFLERTQHVHIDPDDLKLMEQAIEEWCERIDDFPEVNFDE
jgi:hypothetical protein